MVPRSPHRSATAKDTPPETTAEINAGGPGDGPPEPRPGDRLDGRAASVAPLMVLFASFMDLLDVTIVAVAAPSIAADLDASQAQVQWLVASYTLARGSGLITGGRVGDDSGRRRVFLWSLACFAVASAACALVPTAAVLIAVRAVQGLAGGFMVPHVFGIIRSSFEPAAMARAFGAYGAVQGLASVAGPLVGEALVDADLWGLGWRTIFWMNIPVALIAFVLGLRVLPESVAPAPVPVGRDRGSPGLWWRVPDPSAAGPGT